MVFDNVGRGPQKIGLLFPRRLKMDFEQVEGMRTTGRTGRGQTSEIPFADSFTGLSTSHFEEAVKKEIWVVNHNSVQNKENAINKLKKTKFYFEPTFTWKEKT